MSTPVGSRFRRALTGEELARVLDAPHRTKKLRSDEAILVALWNEILADAEGTTWDAAAAAGLKFLPQNYAIPADQADQVLAAMQPTNRAPSARRTQTAMLWFNLGPATY